MIQELMEASHGGLLVPLALLLALTVLAKGLFSLHRSRSQNRKEFLELWRGDHPDDLWLEVVVRHLAGEYLPATLIRSLAASSQAGRALMEVAECWPMLEMDDATKTIRWRRARYSTPARRVRWRIAYWIGYYVAFGCGFFVAYRFSESRPVTSLYWVYPIALMCVGLWCMFNAERLKVAGRSIPRWLGLG